MTGVGGRSNVPSHLTSPRASSGYSISGGTSSCRSTRDTAGNNNNAVRKSGFELLDSPGIIPSDMLDQNDVLLLAACNSIGVGAYDNQAMASYLCDRMQSIVLMGKDAVAAPLWREKCIQRYVSTPSCLYRNRKLLLGGDRIIAMDHRVRG